MPADKDAAKRRRQARNRQEREARQARTESAKRAASRPARTPEETPSRAAKGAKGATTDLSKKSTGRPARTAEASATPAPGGLMGRLFPPRPAPADGDARPVRQGRPPRLPSQVIEVDDATGAVGVLRRLTAQPGGVATVLALFVAVVAAAVLLAFPVWPSPDLTGYGETVVRAQLEADGATDDEIDDAVEAVQTSSLEQLRGVEFGSPGVILVVLISGLPVIIGFFAVRSLLKPTRSRTLMWCAIAGVATIVMNPITGIYFIVGVIALGFAAYQSAKADKAALAAAS